MSALESEELEFPTFRGILGVLIIPFAPAVPSQQCHCFVGITVIRDSIMDLRPVLTRIACRIGSFDQQLRHEPRISRMVLPAELRGD
jgi:hypothetical protein